jgi:hypothetical protein
MAQEMMMQLEVLLTQQMRMSILPTNSVLIEMKVDNDIPSVERVKDKKETPGMNRKSSTSPMGISVKQVAARGKIPNCQYCRKNIARGKWHTVNVSYKYSSQNTDEEKKQWRSQRHYHLGCFQSLNKKEQQQLFSIVNANSDIDESEKDSLDNALKEIWGDNN